MVACVNKSANEWHAEIDISRFGGFSPDRQNAYYINFITLLPNLPTKATNFKYNYIVFLIENI